jgi:PUA domain protein
MKQRTLGKKEIKDINDEIASVFGIEEFFSKKNLVAIIDDKVIVSDGTINLFKKEGKLLPSLKILEKKQFLKTITVDMGALKFLINGADVFRKGAVAIDDGIKKGDLICIIDQNNKKPIAVCEALSDSAEMKKQTEGKIAKNLHHRGDDMWNYSAEQKN